MSVLQRLGIIIVLLLLALGQQSVLLADPDDPEINGTYLLANYDFELTPEVQTDCKSPDPIPTTTQDKDPQEWIVREGESTGGGATVPCRIDTTGGPVTEHSELVKQQSQWNGVHTSDYPDGPSFHLLIIQGTVEYKANIQQAYNPIVTSGVMTQQIQIYVPVDQTDYLQQIEIRRMPGNSDGTDARGQAIKLRFTPEKTELLLANGGSTFNTITLGQQGLSKGTWHTFRIVAKKISPSNALWKITIKQDGVAVYTSNGTTKPYLNNYHPEQPDQFGSVFIGDECDGDPQYVPEGQGECNRPGIILWDNARAIWNPQ